MTALPKVLIVLALWLIYTFFVYTGCLQQYCTACAGTSASEAVTTGEGADSLEAVSKRYALDFKWSDPEAYTNAGFEDLKKKTIAGMTENNILEITGLYFEEEENPGDQVNIGFARAEKMKVLFSGDIPDDKMRLRARLLDEKEGVRTGYFESVSMKWIEPEEKLVETVEELEDRIIIRFPFNSTEKDYDPKVDEYLDKLADRINKSNEKVTLTGHTDNIGPPDPNMAFGLARARKIRDILEQKGVSRAQISVDSKGETQPVASNDAEEGRHENRRVEVRLIKQ